MMDITELYYGGQRKLKSDLINIEMDMQLLAQEEEFTKSYNSAIRQDVMEGLDANLDRIKKKLYSDEKKLLNLANRISKHLFPRYSEKYLENMPFGLTDIVSDSYKESTQHIRELAKQAKELSSNRTELESEYTQISNILDNREEHEKAFIEDLQNKKDTDSSYMALQDKKRRADILLQEFNQKYESLMEDYLETKGSYLADREFMQQYHGFGTRQETTRKRSMISILLGFDDNQIKDKFDDVRERVAFEIKKEQFERLNTDMERLDSNKAQLEQATNNLGWELSKVDSSYAQKIEQFRREYQQLETKRKGLEETISSITKKEDEVLALKKKEAKGIKAIYSGTIEKITYALLEKSIDDLHFFAMDQSDNLNEMILTFIGHNRRMEDACTQMESLKRDAQTRIIDASKEYNGNLGSLILRRTYIQSILDESERIKETVQERYQFYPAEKYGVKGRFGRSNNVTAESFGPILDQFFRGDKSSSELFMMLDEHADQHHLPINKTVNWIKLFKNVKSYTYAPKGTTQNRR